MGTLPINLSASICPCQVQQELREAVKTEQTLREEQAAREHLKEIVVKEQAHAKALEKQVANHCHAASQPHVLRVDLASKQFQDRSL